MVKFHIRSLLPLFMHLFTPSDCSHTNLLVDQVLSAKLRENFEDASYASKEDDELWSEDVALVSRRRLDRESGDWFPSKAVPSSLGLNGEAIVPFSAGIVTLSAASVFKLGELLAAIVAYFSDKNGMILKNSRVLAWVVLIAQSTAQGSLAFYSILVLLYVRPEGDFSPTRLLDYGTLALAATYPFLLIQKMVHFSLLSALWVYFSSVVGKRQLSEKRKQKKIEGEVKRFWDRWPKVAVYSAIVQTIASVAFPTVHDATLGLFVVTPLVFVPLINAFVTLMTAIFKPR